MTALIILLLVLTGVVGVLAIGLLFYVVLRLFKVPTTLGYALLTYVIIAIAELAIAAVAIFSGNRLLEFLVAPICAAVFVYVLYKRHHTSFLKTVGILFAHTIIAAPVPFLLVAPFRAYVSEPFAVFGDAMEPAYQNGDYLILEKLRTSYAQRDVVVLRGVDGLYYIKRIHGVPGDQVRLGDEDVTLGENQYYVRAEDSEFARPEIVSQDWITGSVILELPVAYE